MVLYAGPLVGLLLLLDFAVGIISIYSPQIRATVLAIPLKCLLGLLFSCFICRCSTTSPANGCLSCAI